MPLFFCLIMMITYCISISTILLYFKDRVRTLYVFHKIDFNQYEILQSILILRNLNNMVLNNIMLKYLTLKRINCSIILVHMMKN